jgi:hypothetical protein
MVNCWFAVLEAEVTRIASAIMERRVEDER